MFSYWIYIMCQYDLKPEPDIGRIKYFLRIDRRRGILLGLSLAACIGLSQLFAWYHYGPLKVVRYLLLLAMLCPTAQEDAREKMIPNRWIIYILAGRICLFMLETVFMPSLFMENLAFTLFGGAACGVVFLVVYVLSRHAIGMGDVKLIAAIGSCLGFQTTYLIMLAASILSSAYGVIMILRKKKELKDEMAFGPFIAIGTLVVLLIGA